LKKCQKGNTATNYSSWPMDNPSHSSDQKQEKYVGPELTYTAIQRAIMPSHNPTPTFSNENQHIAYSCPGEHSHHTGWMGQEL